MMERLMRRAEALVEEARRAKVAAVAARLRTLLGDASVEVEEARVLVRGRGLIKRWLVDPSLRFFAGGLK
jgi:hypothetical protein